MFDRIFGNYLIEQQILDKTDLDKIFTAQDKMKARLGVIAVSENLITETQANEINRLQSQLDKRFGDIAVEKGYLTDNQVTRLLALQGNAFLNFLQATVDNTNLTMNELSEALNKYQKDNSYTLTDMENLKSCDIDRIVPIYVYELPEYAQNFVGIALRTISRLVDNHVYLDKPFSCDKLISENICRQPSLGDYNILVAISGNANSIIDFAKGFAGADLIDDIDDAMDSTCELINSINGLFASELSHSNINIDMEPPAYKYGSGVINSEEIINLPIYIFGKEVLLSLVLSDNYTIE